MKNQRIIIHSGFPKTGSTALQDALFNTSSDEYLYPKLTLGFKQEAGKIGLAVNFNEQ